MSGGSEREGKKGLKNTEALEIRYITRHKKEKASNRRGPEEKKKRKQSSAGPFNALMT